MTRARVLEAFIMTNGIGSFAQPRTTFNGTFIICNINSLPKVKIHKYTKTEMNFFGTFIITNKMHFDRKYGATL